MFPLKLISKVMSEFKPVQPVVDNGSDSTNPTEKRCDKRYFKLPFVGAFSSLANKKLASLVHSYCNEIDARFIFETFKIGCYFSCKDSVPRSLLSHVVYNFSCAGCGVCYVGETTRHFEQRVKEHLSTDTSSAINKHLKENPHCKNSCNNTCFSIIDRAHSRFQLIVKEALYIKIKKPVLNLKVFSYTPKLLL